MRQLLKIKFLAVLLLPVFTFCRRLDAETETGSGYLGIHFSEQAYALTKSTAENLPDTCDFLLKVTDSGGKVIYDGKYGDSSEKILVKSGTYNISVRSAEFSKPSFSSPQYGDDQCVVVQVGKTAHVYLDCDMQNAGIRLVISPDFLKSYPDGVLFLKSSAGKLMYGYSEKRVAYFQPGNVTLVLYDGGKDKSLTTKKLKPKQVLVLSVQAPSAGTSGAGISIAVDTAKAWVSDRYVIGAGSGSAPTGGAYKDALSVSQAKSELDAKGVWVYGYIVGGDLTASSVSFDEPFESESNIAIAGRTTVYDKESCMSVQLLKGKVRDALNLVSNPSNLKRKVFLKGDIVESYFGIPGVKNISECVIE